MTLMTSISTSVGEVNVVVVTVELVVVGKAVVDVMKSSEQKD